VLLAHEDFKAAAVAAKVAPGDLAHWAEGWTGPRRGLGAEPRPIGFGGPVRAFGFVFGASATGLVVLELFRAVEAARVAGPRE
jgi:hypothetical protein